MTTLYYLPRENMSGNLASLPQEEAHHAVHVVRHKVGDLIHAVDGEGGRYHIRLNRVGKGIAEGEIVHTQFEVGEPHYELTVAMAILKNQKRFDLFVEKAAELGVSRIIPIITDRTEKKTIKDVRVQKILIAAMKQCGRSRLIEFDEIKTLSDLAEEASYPIMLCCHEKAPEEATLNMRLIDHKEEKKALVIIGPEGGLTDQEVELMQSVGCNVVSLGDRRLRAETAAIVASTGVMLQWS